MIRYALACEAGHAFESWFPSGDAFDAQAARGLVECPVCGSTAVGKGIMAPALGKRAGEPHPGSGGSATPAGSVTPAGPAALRSEAGTEAPRPVALLSEREQAIRAMLRAVREHVTRTADYVGTGFADEARRMHYGEIEHRSIYGEANPADAKALLDEGIEVHPLPVAPEDRN